MRHHGTCSNEATVADVAIADAVAANTARPTEHVAEAVTWGADEHVLCALAFGWWLFTRTSDGPVRRVSDHVLLTTLVASALPHVLTSKKGIEGRANQQLVALMHQADSEFRN
jgi:hypothetical protein